MEKDSEKELGENQDGADRNSCIWQGGRSHSKAQERRSRLGPLTSLYILPCNALLEHCSLETEESQPPLYLDPFPLL